VPKSSEEKEGKKHFAGREAGAQERKERGKGFWREALRGERGRVLAGDAGLRWHAAGQGEVGRAEERGARCHNSEGEGRVLWGKSRE